MEELPSINISDKEKIEMHTNVLIGELIRSVTIYILTKDLKSNFYNFSDFFLKHKLDIDEVKKNLKTIVIDRLKSSGYKVAYVFNETGLVIERNGEDINNNVWKSNLDFKEL